MKILLTLLLLITLTGAHAQEKLWISDKSYILVRDDFQGFYQVDSVNWRMTEINDTCTDGDKNVIIDGVGTFSSMPCFRDYLLSQGNKIIVWGKLMILEDQVSHDSDKIVYEGNWKGATMKFSNVANNTVTYSFEIGTRSKLIIRSEKHNTHGIANIQINNGQSVVYDETIDMYAANVCPYDIPIELEAGSYTIQITVTGQKNELSSNYYFVLFGFAIEKTDYYVEDYEVISSHNEFHKALEKSIELGGKRLVRKGKYKVVKEGDKIVIKQPDFEIK